MLLRRLRSNEYQIKNLLHSCFCFGHLDRYQFREAVVRFASLSAELDHFFPSGLPPLIAQTQAIYWRRLLWMMVKDRTFFANLVSVWYRPRGCLPSMQLCLDAVDRSFGVGRFQDYPFTDPDGDPREDPFYNFFL